MNGRSRPLKAPRYPAAQASTHTAHPGHWTQSELDRGVARRAYLAFAQHLAQQMFARRKVAIERAEPDTAVRAISSSEALTPSRAKAVCAAARTNALLRMASARLAACDGVGILPSQ